MGRRLNTTVQAGPFVYDAGTDEDDLDPSVVDSIGDDLWDGAKTDAGTDEGGYDGFKVADLKAEIERRNTGRDEADLIPADGNKAALIAALTADDQASTEQDQD